MDTPNFITKTCAQCRVEKPIYEFHKHAREKDGYRKNCKQCRADNGECRYIKPAPTGFKYCRKCNTLFPATTEYFYWDASSQGLYASCKSCHYLRTRDWQKRNHEFWHKLNRQWAVTHPKKIKLHKNGLADCSNRCLIVAKRFKRFFSSPALDCAGLLSKTLKTPYNAFLDYSRSAPTHVT